MGKNGGIRVAVVGLGFGSAFVPIYKHHPDVASLVICDSDPVTLAGVGDRFAVTDRVGSFEALLDDATIDAVHLVTPIPLHARQTLAVLNAGKHCACTVPMATTIDDLHAIVAAAQHSQRNYMMMETAVYTREFLFVEQLQESGTFGRIQFLRGAHYQDMENWPPYWLGLPPMHYATHAVAPLLALAGCRARRVHCFGSGTMREELRRPYGNPFPVETAIFTLADEALAAEVTRTLFHTARSYTESFTVLGEQASFEWQQIENEEPVLFRMEPLQPGRGRPISFERVRVPDFADRLPPSIARFTQFHTYEPEDPKRAFGFGGGHGGAHPHLVHEFVRSIVERRMPRIHAVVAADWTAPGICAHQSAMRGGKAVDIPQFGEIL